MKKSKRSQKSMSPSSDAGEYIPRAGQPAKTKTACPPALRLTLGGNNVMVSVKNWR